MNRVIYEKKDRIAYVTLNRPGALNAYSCLGDFSQARERLDRFFSRGGKKDP